MWQSHIVDKINTPLLWQDGGDEVVRTSQLRRELGLFRWLARWSGLFVFCCTAFVLMLLRYMLGLKFVKIFQNELIPIFFRHEDTS